MYVLCVLQDKKDVPLWLGGGPDGICQCSHSNRNEPDGVRMV